MSLAGDAGKWTAAAIVAGGSHVAVAMWLLMPNLHGAAEMAPTPVFVDLAPADPVPAEEPVADEIAPEPEPEIAEAEPEPMPEPEPEIAEAEPEPMPEPEPEPEIAEVEPEPEPEPEPVELASFTPPPLMDLPPVADLAEIIEPAPDQPVLETSERPVQRPVRRKVEPTPPVEPRKTPPRQTPPKPSQTATPRQQQPAPATPRQTQANAAPAQRQQSGGQAGPSKSELARWQANVGARIARHMSRTSISGRGRGVTVQISVTIGPSGAASARLASSTGDPRNDAALSAQAARMPSMPAPPARRAESFVLPVVVR